MDTNGGDDFYNPHGAVTKLVKKAVTIQQHLKQMNEMLLSDDKDGGGGGKMMNQCKDKIWCPDKERRAATHAEDYKMYWAPRVRPLNPNSRFGQQMQFLSPGNVRKPEPTRDDYEYGYDDGNDNHFTWYINQDGDDPPEENESEDEEGYSNEEESDNEGYQPSQRAPSTKRIPRYTRNHSASDSGRSAPSKHMKHIHQRRPQEPYHREESDPSSSKSHRGGARSPRQLQLRDRQRAENFSPRVRDKEDAECSAPNRRRYERSCNDPQQQEKQENYSIRIPLVVKLSSIRRRQHDPTDEERFSSRDANSPSSSEQQRAVFTLRVPPKLASAQPRAARSHPPPRKRAHQNDRGS